MTTGEDLPANFSRAEWTPTAASTHSLDKPGVGEGQAAGAGYVPYVAPVNEEPGDNEPDGPAWLIAAQQNPAASTAAVTTASKAPAKPAEKTARRDVLVDIGLGAAVIAGLGVFSREVWPGWGRKPLPAPLPVPRPGPTKIEPTPPSPERLIYPKHEVTAIFFGIGESDTQQMAWESGYDPDTGEPVVITNFGGVDRRRDRKPDGSPAGFEANEWINYLSLPYDDQDENGWLIEAMEASFWADKIPNLQPGQSLFRGIPVEVTHYNLVTGEVKVAYAQWRDTAVKDTGKEAAEKWVFSEEDTIEPEHKPQVKLSYSMIRQLGVPEDAETARVTVRFVNWSEVPKTGIYDPKRAITNETEHI